MQASVYGWVKARVPFKIGNTVLIKQGGLSPVIPFVCAGIVVLGLFVLWQRHLKNAGKQPLLDLTILKGRAAAVGLPTVMALMFMQAGLLFVAPVYLQMSLGLSPLLSGLTVLPLTVFPIVVSQMTAKLTARFSPRSLVRLGMLLIPVGIVVVWLMLQDKPKAIQMIPGFIIVGIGIGLAAAPLLNMVQSSALAAKQGDISGVNRAVSNLGGALGTAVAGAILMSVLIASLSGLIMKNNVIPADGKTHLVQALPQDAKTVSDAQAKKYLSRKGFQPDVANALYDINQTARNKGLLSALLAIGVLGLLGFACSIFLPRGALGAAKVESDAAGAS